MRPGWDRTSFAAFIAAAGSILLMTGAFALQGWPAPRIPGGLARLPIGLPVAHLWLSGYFGAASGLAITLARGRHEARHA